MSCSYFCLVQKLKFSFSKANHVAEESLSTIRTVRSFANEDGEMASYGIKLKEVLNHKIRQALVFNGYGE